MIYTKPTVTHWKQNDLHYSRQQNAQVAENTYEYYSNSVNKMHCTMKDIVFAQQLPTMSSVILKCVVLAVPTNSSW